MTDQTMTLEQATDFFAEAFLGKHHIPSEVRPWCGGWKVNAFAGDLGLSTYDADMLTRLVFLAHDRCIRLSVRQGGPQAVAIVIHQRDTRTGSINHLHPTLDQALANWRMFHPAPPGPTVAAPAPTAAPARPTPAASAARPHWTDVLGVTRDASTSEAREAYREKKDEVHGWSGGMDPEMAAELQKLREAYDACCREHQVEDTGA